MKICAQYVLNTSVCFKYLKTNEYTHVHMVTHYTCTVVRSQLAKVFKSLN